MTTNNGRTQRKSLANEIDRLDNILDGLDEALAGAVELAVRDVTARVVREAVEATLKEVLASPELLRIAAARHAPEPTPETPRRTLREWLDEKLARLCRKAGEKVAQVKRWLINAWSWCVRKVRQSCSWLWSRGKDTLTLAAHVGKFALSAVPLAWRFRKASAIALGVGTVVGVVAYFAGPVIASLLCGLGGSAMTAAGMVLLPLWKLMSGGSASS